MAEEELQRYLEDLKDEDYEVRRWAARALEQLEG